MYEVLSNKTTEKFHELVLIQHQINSILFDINNEKWTKHDLPGYTKATAKLVEALPLWHKHRYESRGAAISYSMIVNLQQCVSNRDCEELPKISSGSCHSIGNMAAYAIYLINRLSNYQKEISNLRNNRGQNHPSNY